MHYNISTYYSCVSLASIPNGNALDKLLKQFTVSALPNLLSNDHDELWDAFDDIREDIESGDPDFAASAMVKLIREHITELSYQDAGVSMVIGSVEEGDAYCGTLVESLCKFLLPYSSDPYLLLCAAGFDKGGGYAHQFLLHNKDGQVVKEHIHDLIEHMFANPATTIGDLFPAAVSATAA